MSRRATAAPAPPAHSAAPSRTRPAVAVLAGVVAVLVAVPLAVLVPASAAVLVLSGGSMTAFTRQHPCPGEVTVTAAAGTVSSVNATVPVACAGRQLRVAVLLGGAAREGVAVVPADGRAVVPLNPAVDTTSVTGAQATVSGWSSPARWSPPAAPGPAAVRAGSANTALTVTWRTQGTRVCADIQVWTTTPGVRWRVDVDTNLSPWNGATSGYEFSQGWVTLVSSGGGILTVDGGPGANGTRTADNPATISICHPNPPPAP